MQNVKISLIIPAFNEEAIIRKTIETVLSYLELNFSEYELVIADDGSTDDTKSIAESTGNPHLVCVSHTPNKGKGCAVREGIMAADGDVLIYTDADLAYGIDAVGELAQKIESDGTDLAIGSRKLHPQGYRDYPPIRLIASRLFSFLTGRLAGFNYDTQCGLKAFSSKAAKDIFSRCETDGFAFDFEVMMYAMGLSYTVAQIPVMVKNHRESKVRVFRDSIIMFWDIVSIRKTVRKRIKGEKLF